MDSDQTAPGIDWTGMLDGIIQVIRPMLPWLVLACVVLLVVACPLPGRGPGLFPRRDPWRGFRFEARRAVLHRAGNRCEAALVLAWGRCLQPAQEVDHVYPHSRGGATVVSNGQALCTSHNRSKSNLVPRGGMCWPWSAGAAATSRPAWTSACAERWANPIEPPARRGWLARPADHDQREPR